MLPVVAIVGRPNVGKSTLFNCLTSSRQALISAFPGMTRDRQYGDAAIHGRKFIVIDTGGITEESDEIDQLISSQAALAIQESDLILFVVDAKAEVTPEDQAIAQKLRISSKPVFLVMNKVDGLDANLQTSYFYELGLGDPIGISAAHRRGIKELVETIFPEQTPEQDAVGTEGIRLAIVGRPNVGKSTLTNRILGEERVIVHDSPGTTRDSIAIPLTRHEQQYTIIDTAGVRKRTKVNEAPEKFSVVKTLQSIEHANIILYVIDARLGVREQDLKLLGFILECGKGLVIAINKWDGLDQRQKDQVKASIDRQLDFVGFARVHFISALHGSGVGDLFKSITEAFESATRKLSTPKVTRLLQLAVSQHAPPLVKGRRIKMRYAHPGGHNPPRIIIHGNQLDALPKSYRKYLAHFFQTRLKLYGTPVYIEFKTTENPYAK